ncbi:MAG: hypothetical protein AB7N76_02395 [Planctomycetota bacterium]
MATGLAACALLLASPPHARAGDEARENAPQALLGEVSLRLEAARAGRAPEVVVAAASEAPAGSLVQAALFDDGPRRRASARGEVRGGRVELRLALPREAKAGFFQVVLAYQPNDQPRYVARAPRAAYRRVPLALGSAEEAQAARDRGAANLRRLGDESLRLAQELERRFAAPPSAEELVPWLERRAPPLVRDLRQAVAAASLDPEAAELLQAARAALARCDTDVRAACASAEVRPPRELLEDAPRAAPDHRELVVQVLSASARARRAALAPEPAPGTLDRLSRRVAWLRLVAAGIAADVARPEACAWALDDLRRSLSRLEAPAAGLPGAGPARGQLRQAQQDIEAWQRAPLDALHTPRAAAALAALAQALAALEQARLRAEAAAGRAALEAFAQELPEAGPAPLLRRDLAARLAAHFAAWPRHEPCVRWLEAELTSRAAGHPETPAAARRWRELLAGLAQ